MGCKVRVQPSTENKAPKIAHSAGGSPLEMLSDVEAAGRFGRRSGSSCACQIFFQAAALPGGGIDRSVLSADSATR